MILCILCELLDLFKRFIMKKLCLLVCMFLGLSVIVMVEGDVEVGKVKFVVCVVCYGFDGNSMIDMNLKIVG